MGMSVQLMLHCSMCVGSWSGRLSVLQLGGSCAGVMMPVATATPLAESMSFLSCMQATTRLCPSRLHNRVQHALWLLVRGA